MVRVAAQKTAQSLLPDLRAGTAALGSMEELVHVKVLSIANAPNPVLYGSISSGEARPTGPSRNAINARLASILWNHLRAMRPALTEELVEPVFEPRRHDLQIVNGDQGEPLLLVGGRRGPSISFSHLAGKTWGALSAGKASIGIDAACADEFRPPYPLLRAFAIEEFAACLAITPASDEEAAALLWSVKEAAAKAIGCGFRFVDPLNLVASVPRDADAETTFEVNLVGRPLKRLPWMAARTVSVQSLNIDGIWISVAMTDFIRPYPSTVSRLTA